jgi:hypothetical protein
VVSGLTELRLSVPEPAGDSSPPRRGVAHDVGKRALKGIGKGDDAVEDE